MGWAACGLGIGLWLVAVTTGCGYRSVLGGPTAARQAADRGERVTRIAIASLRNDAPEPWLDRIVGDALRRELRLRGRIELVSDPATADWLLRGRIRPLTIRSNSFSSFVAALEYSVTLELDLELHRPGGAGVRLDPRTLSETELYLASPDIEVTRSNRLEALRHLSDVLSTRVADAVEWMGRESEAEAPEARPSAEMDQRVRPPRTSRAIGVGS